MGRSIAQDFGPALDVELTKEVRVLGTHTLPLGLPSGVRIAAITFEKSPLQMKVTSSEPGNAFVQPQKPTFQVQLTNITAQEQPFTLTAVATHLDGTTAQAKASGKVAAGATEKVSLEIAVPKRGYYDLAVTLSDGQNRPLVTRKTSLALLPPDTRKHRGDVAIRNMAIRRRPFRLHRSGPDRPALRQGGLALRHVGIQGRRSDEIWRDQRARNPPSPAGPRTSDTVPRGIAMPLEKNATLGLDPHPVARMFHEDGIEGKTAEEREKKLPEIVGRRDEVRPIDAKGISQRQTRPG